MEARKIIKENISTRRNMLKKVGFTSVFVVPTIMTFKISELKACASILKPPNPPGGDY